MSPLHTHTYIKEGYIRAQIESAAELSSSGFSFTSPISPITLSARPSAWPSAPLSQKNNDYLSEIPPFQMYSAASATQILGWMYSKLADMLVCTVASWLADYLAFWWLPGLFGHLRCHKWWIPQWVRSGQMAWPPNTPPCECEERRGARDASWQSASVSPELRSACSRSWSNSETHNIPMHTKQRLWIVMFRDLSCIKASRHQFGQIH